MKNFKFYKISSGLFTIIAGLMLALLRGSILNLLLTVVGIGFIVSGLAFGVKHITKFSLLKIIIGICTIAFGNTFINLSMYILGIALIILGVFRFFSTKANFGKIRRYMISSFVPAVLPLIAGICILFNPMGSIESLFYVCGILLIVGGAWDLFLGVKWMS